MDIKDARSLSAAAQEELRKRAIKAVLGGMPQTEAARAFGVTRQAIGRWLRAYRRGGAEALCARPQGRPRGGTIKEAQAARLLGIMEAHLPDQVHLPYPLWTTEAVARLIEQETGLALSLWTIRRLLRRWGLDLQKPLKRALERNPREARRWVREAYPAIARAAAADNAVIFWASESVFQAAPATPGEPPAARRAALAVSNQGHLRFLVAPQGAGLTPRLGLIFLERLLQQARRRKVTLIAEPMPFFSSPQVAAWLAENERRLRLHLLPDAGREAAGPGASPRPHRAA